MLLSITTTRPKGLLAAIKKAIEDGDIKTWTCDSDGDLTHKAAQWTKCAWLHPQVGDGILVFHTVPPQGRQPTDQEVGFYLGHMVETLLAHFQGAFTAVTVG